MELSILSFSLYLVLMVAMGIYFYFKTRSVDGYILGNRSLGPIPSAISAGASDMSGWLLLGLPGLAITGGFQAVWMSLGLFLGTTLNWVLLSKRLRVYSVELEDTLTIPTFIEKRLNDKSGVLRLVTAFFILLFFLFYTSSGLIAGGKLFSNFFNVDYRISVVIGAFVIISYTFVGGYLAVSWTDVVQGLLMIFALIVVPLVTISHIGGWNSFWSSLAKVSPNGMTPFMDPSGKTMDFLGILSMLGWGLGYFGQPHILARFMGISSHKKTGIATGVVALWSLVGMVSAIFVGLSGLVFFGGVANIGDPETIFLELVPSLFHPLFAGVLLSAVMAAIMSTADSQLLVAGAAISTDVVQKFIKKGHFLHGQDLKITRAAVLLLSILAIFIAFNGNSSILKVVAFAWAGLGATCGPIMLISLWWRGVTALGGIAGVVVGGVTVIVWHNLSGGVFDLYELVPSFLFSCVAIVVVSLLSGKPSKEMVDTFEKVRGIVKK